MTMAPMNAEDQAWFAARRDPLIWDAPETAMWECWRDKKGIVEALKQQYREVIDRDNRLAMALVQIESAEALIDKIMTDLGV